MASTRARCILPLPPDVVVQIKSSTAIVSLAGVVVELLKNALDAGATKVEATVDFGRGGCSVEDNGRGIAPLEFREEGALGKLHCTSKYYSHDALYGRNGAFLASLAAMSLVTITSRHHEYRSLNSMTFHHCKAIDRQLPAPPQLELSDRKHGTRVTVRNLFGNLPVRVKQRAVVLEHKVENDRLWDSLKKEVTGLILSWRGSISLRVRDVDNKPAFILNSQTAPTSPRLGAKATNKPRSNELQFILNVLTQSNYISIDEWPVWVPASASTSNISIKGAISLDPSPNKSVQFISFEIQPLSSDAGHNELYDEVNRIFGLSSFGTIEDDTVIEEFDKVRRQKDKRFKSDGYTNRQLRARKGVDRFPMFHLRISLKDGGRSKGLEDKFLDNDTNLQAVIEVLNVMITQWLSVHHLRPRKRYAGRDQLDTMPSSSSTTDRDRRESKSNPGVHSHVGQQITDRESFELGSYTQPSSILDNRKRKRSAILQTRTASEQTRQQPFAEWSRIKSGKAAFYDNVWTSGKQRTPRRIGDPLSSTCVGPEQSSKSIPFSKGSAVFDTEPIPRGPLNASAVTGPSRHTTHSRENGTGSGEDVCDDIITWIDPRTKHKFTVNARTGCAMPEVPRRPLTEHSVPGLLATVNEFTKSLRTRPRSTGTDAERNPWLHALLQTWDNPIFKPTEKRIQQVSLGEQQLDGRGHNHSSHSSCSRIDIDKAFSESSLSNGSKLSKTGLQNTRVIAQLDKKFILVKMVESSPDSGEEAEILVMIDQHAADERIRVEALFAELCAPLPSEHTHSQYRSKLGHMSHVAFTILDKPLRFFISSQEREHFTTHAARFGVWGILYDLATPATTTAMSRISESSQAILSVTTLPPSISERCRADTNLLISFLRSTLWKYTEDPHLPLRSDLPWPSSSDSEESPLWMRRLATCPRGLVDFVNSRACRSAIMFNDELSMQECEEIVAKLSKCAFPFMCAHGRPSMVPLINLGHAKVNGSLGLELGFDAPKQAENGFVHAWKQRQKQ
ncbi:DNA mismatch repair protein [Melanomma pulvis-pyrius CBS 109.77]|uniref:DNA mismatch repair protein n=1 Tax=Melanomma pulvis-pyrius CBS 109.77 TaxID=1314802 RepID=A0A6A6XAK6_9PLEO|nr:DNA mismatch repair protein [Melanomma pulvis-pyrius CBS 109.77]